MKLTGCKSYRRAMRHIEFEIGKEPLLDSAVGRRRLKQGNWLAGVNFRWCISLGGVMLLRLLSDPYLSPWLYPLVNWGCAIAPLLYALWMMTQMVVESGRMARLKRVLTESAAVIDVPPDQYHQSSFRRASLRRRRKVGRKTN